MTVKKLIWRLVLPLTIILFGTITKWWYVLPEDAPDSMLTGFPFAYAGDGWWTSMSVQIFAVEFFVDFVVYYLFCLFVVLLTKRIVSTINIPKVVTVVIWTLAMLTTTYWALLFGISEKQIKIKRDWKMQILTTGFTFSWLHHDRPDITKYKPDHK